jgi:uroporphyrin-III C-methyltransferase / precorrin-2 dehydrogenase / sirohydrochlorin ferrochelatase
VIPSLPLFHRIAGQPVIVLGEGEAAEAKRRLVERAGGEVVGADDRDARLAFVAMDEPEAAAARLRARDVLVNVADRPDLCDFTVPSLLERGPVIVAVGTGGVSAGLAKALRLRLEAVLPHSLGALAEALGAAREKLRGRWPDAAERRRALDAGLAEGGALDPLDAGSAARFDDWLGGAEADLGGLVEIVLTSSDPDDLTLRQARWLGTADRVHYHSEVPAAVLARSRADAVRRLLDGSEIPAAHSGLTVVIRMG